MPALQVSRESTAKLVFHVALFRVRTEDLARIRPISALTPVPALQVSPEPTVKPLPHAARIHVKTEDLALIREISVLTLALAAQASPEQTAKTLLLLATRSLAKMGVLVPIQPIPALILALVPQTTRDQLVKSTTPQQRKFKTL